MQQVHKPQQSWIRQCEHYVLRVLSILFSAVSAHAILWFYSSMDRVIDTSDPLQPYVKWGLALGFTALGYFVSRGLVHRMLNKERIAIYMVISLLLELVEISANFAQGAVSIRSIDWLHLFSGPIYMVLVVMVYLVMPIVPLFTIALAVVDMDMDRAKQGYTVRGFGMNNTAGSAVPPRATAPQPKQDPRQATPTTSGYAQPSPTYPTAPTARPPYQQGYAPQKAPTPVQAAQQERDAPAVPIAASASVPQRGGTASPFLTRTAVPGTRKEDTSVQKTEVVPSMG